MSGPAANSGTDRQPTPGIIDTIGLAFGLLNRRPYLIWILIAFDILTWAGPRVHYTGTESVSGGNADRYLLEMSERLTEIELMSVLTWALPTLIDSSSMSMDSRPFNSGLIEIDGVAGTALILAGSLLSAFVAMSYLTIIGRLVSNRPVTTLLFVRDSLRAGYRAIGVATSIALLIAFMTIPFVLAGLGLHVVGVDPTGLLVLVALMTALWLGVFFILSFASVALGERSVSKALRSSYRIVHGNFLAVAALIAIFAIIRAGTPPALAIFMESKWSVPFAVVANAYIATGLIAAFMLFFQNRSSTISHSITQSARVTGG